jgi:hypothetical protein
LGKCQYGSHSIKVSKNNKIPVLRILGNNIRTLKRNRINQFIGQTLNGWYHKDDKISIGLMSLSKDPSKYILPSYSLIANQYYKIKLIVSYQLKTYSSSLSILVFVEQGEIIAVIIEGLVRNIVADSSVAIDASASYDEDISGIYGVAAGLQFLWSCIIRTVLT